MLEGWCEAIKIVIVVRIVVVNLHQKESPVAVTKELYHDQRIVNVVNF